MEAKLAAVSATDDDVLVIQGEIEVEVFDADLGEAVARTLPITAYGWVSALSNHYDAQSYDADGNLKNKAKARKMTQAETREYCQRLLDEAAALVVAPAAPPSSTPVDIGL